MQDPALAVGTVGVKDSRRGATQRGEHQPRPPPGFLEEGKPDATRCYVGLCVYPLQDANNPRIPREFQGLCLQAAQNPAHFRPIPPPSTPTCKPSSTHGPRCPRRSGRASWPWSRRRPNPAGLKGSDAMRCGQHAPRRGRHAPRRGQNATHRRAGASAEGGPIVSCRFAQTPRRSNAPHVTYPPPHTGQKTVG